MGQPFLHELVTCLRAPTTVLSGRDGQLRAGGAHGLFHADTRFLSTLVATVNGHEPRPIGLHVVDGGRCRFVAAVVGVGDDIADPTVRLERERTVTASGMTERMVFINDGRATVAFPFTVHAGADLAPIDDVKQGRAVAGVEAASGLRVEWSAGAARSALHVRHGGSDLGEAILHRADDDIVLSWDVEVASRSSVDLLLEIEVEGDVSDDAFVSIDRPPWSATVGVTSPIPHLCGLVDRSLDDLAALLLGDPASTSNGTVDAFSAAGSPWFLTLFGRDSLWTARFTLPLTTELAAGTLRTLARRQARHADATTAAEPGKILHEVRARAIDIGTGILPPVYYGTVDATPLWVSLLHDAWCWGLPDEEVVDLLDAMEVALDWVVDHGDGDGPGFLSYRDSTGGGLTNQGWKDSGDSIQDGAGTIATAPITLCEVQGYAYRAAIDGARLLDAFGRSGAARARGYAASLAERFRASFWVGHDGGRFPAIALDGHGCPVDSLTSNIGHLLGTGILDPHEQATVAGLLADARLMSGYGLRTLDAEHPHYNPVGYHTGSVWPHDTAIAIDGLARTGHAATAAALATGLLEASAHFEYRLPELFGGWPAADRPLAYPAACRPQAWSAGSVFAVLRAALGLEADVPSGTLAIRPDPAFGGFFPLVVRGLRVGRHRLDVSVDAAGAVDVETDAPLAILTT